MFQQLRNTGSSTRGNLAALPIGERAVILGLNTGAGFRRRLLDLGFIPGTVVEAVRLAPGGDPMAVNVRGAVIALRLDDAVRIAVLPLSEET